MVDLFPILQLRFDLLSQLFGAVCIVRRNHHVEDDVHVVQPGDQTEIMKRQARINPMQDRKHPRAHGADLRIVGDDGVIVDDKIDVQRFFRLPLDFVQQLMGDERVDAVVDLGVDAGKAAARRKGGTG